MNRLDFRKQLKTLTHFEQKLKSSNNPELVMVHHFNKTAKKDENGYFYLTNLGMNTNAVQTLDIRESLLHPTLNEKLRMIIHSRFSILPFHSHEFISINYVYSGRLILNFPNENESVTLETGQFFVMNTNVVHSFKIESENDIIMGFQIEKEFLSRELLYGLKGDNPVVDFLIKTLSGHESDFSYIISTYCIDDKMKNVFEDMMCEYLEPSVCSEQLVINYLKIFFVLLMRSDSDRLKINTKANIPSMLNYIDKHCATCTLSDLANEFHFNPKYLSQLIKQKTGFSFSYILTESRMKSVCYYLENTDLSIKEIAIMCGYTNQNFFYKKFYQRYSMTPSQYRGQKHQIK